MYYGALPHSLPHYPFFFFLQFLLSWHLCGSLQEHSKCTPVWQVWMCVLVLSTLGQHLSIHQLPLCPSLHYFTRQIEHIAGSFDSHWLAQLCGLPCSAWYKCSPRASCWKLFHFCNDCKKKTVTKSLGKCCTAWTSTFLIPKIPVSTFSMPFPCLFDLNTHAEYALPQTGLLPIKWQSIGFVTALPKDGLFLLISTNEKS